MRKGAIYTLQVSHTIFSHLHAFGTEIRATQIWYQLLCLGRSFDVLYKNSFYFFGVTESELAELIYYVFVKFIE